MLNFKKGCTPFTKTNIVIVTTQITAINAQIKSEEDYEPNKKIYGDEDPRSAFLRMRNYPQGRGAIHEIEQYKKKDTDKAKNAFDRYIEFEKIQKQGKIKTSDCIVNAKKFDQKIFKKQIKKVINTLYKNHKSKQMMDL